MWAPTQGRVPHPSWEPRKESPNWGAHSKTSACSAAGTGGGGNASGCMAACAAGCSRVQRGHRLRRLRQIRTSSWRGSARMSWRRMRWGTSPTPRSSSCCRTCHTSSADCRSRWCPATDHCRGTFPSLQRGWASLQTQHCISATGQHRAGTHCGGHS